MIQRGDADVMICGGAEARHLAVWESAVSPPCARSPPATTSRREPAARGTRTATASWWAKARAFWSSRNWRRAQRRGAPIVAEVIGYGMSGDAFHISAPPEDGDGAFRVMRNALRDAGIEPAAIDYINAHGTSTDVGDRVETIAIKRCFGEHAYKLAVSSTKSMTGHLLGAAGGLEAGITVLAIRDQIAPPTINHECPDPGLRSRLRAERGAARSHRLRSVEFLRVRRHQRLPDFQALYWVATTRG